MTQRPLSPHLQIYRLPVTGLLSFSHRISGVLVVIGCLALVTVPLSVASGAASYGMVHQALASPVGRILLWLWILCFLFHLCHGLRHLLWDMGLGFSRDKLARNAAIELAACVVLYASVWLASLGIF